MVALRWLVLVPAAACASAGEPAPAGVDARAPQPPVDAPAMPVDAPLSACAQRLATLATGFEAGTAGWTHVVLDGASAPGWPLDEWQHGTATSGPGSCHAGTGCWATRLDTNYTSCERAALVSPPLDLSPCAGEDVTLSFWSWHDFWSGTVSGKTGVWYDGGLVEVSASGTSWTEVSPSPPYVGTIKINPSIGSHACVSQTSFHVNNKLGLIGTGGWQQISIPIPASAISSTFRVRFAYATGVSYADDDAEGNRAHARPGWYLDDLAFATP